MGSEKFFERTVHVAWCVFLMGGRRERRVVLMIGGDATLVCGGGRKLRGRGREEV